MSASRYPAPAELRDLIIMLLQVGKLVQVGLSAELESAIGLTVGEIDVLANLAHAPDGRLRMSQISDRLVVNRTGVTRLIDSLAERGLVERQAAEGDRRGVCAVITEAGRDRFVRGAPIVLESLDRQIGDRVSSDEVAVIQAAFAKILTGLGSGEAGCGVKVDDAAKALAAKAGPGPTPTETIA